MQSKITIGITGGIGSGKSMVCRVLCTMGYPVFYSDNEAKRILEEDSFVKNQIIQIFGDEAYQNNFPNKEFLAKQIFNDESLRLKINQIIHPHVRKNFVEWTKLQKTSLVFNEAAILFETGSYKNFDQTILVISPLELRISRIMSRDGISREEVESRMSKQWSDDEKIALANHIIKNDEINLLVPQINKIVTSLNK